MKRKIILILGLLLLVGLGYYAVTLIKGRGHSNENFEQEQFAIKDTAAIDKVVIKESSGIEFEIIRKGKVWTAADGSCIPQTLVNNILDAAYNIRFKSFVATQAQQNVINRMASQGKEVQLYVNGEWVKTWFLGSSTPDHMGTYMMQESDEFGKTEEPVIAELENMVGILEPRFFADPRKWACTEVFDYEISEISSVEVKFPNSGKNNFKIDSKGSKFKVYNNGNELLGLNDALVTKYLAGYKKVNYELPNYELTKRQVDSVKSSTPFCILKISTKMGVTKQLKMFRRKADNGEAENVGNFGEDFGAYDINRFWCQLPNGDLVKCQYFVFDKLMRGDIYFGFKK